MSEQNRDSVEDLAPSDDGLAMPSLSELDSDLALRAARPEIAQGLQRQAALQRVLSLATAGSATPMRVGHFELGRKLGEGGMGVVYLATDIKLGREVAIKFLRAEHSADAQARIVKEARLLARFTDRHVVAIYEVGVFKSSVYFVMEYLAAGNLHEWLKAHPRCGVRRVLELFIQAGRGLHAAHRKGLVHRDFKPANVFLADDGDARVGDFGLATIDRGDRGQSHPLVSSSSDWSSPNAATVEAKDQGRTIRAGTPAFMSPEQFAGRPSTALSDQYSFCLSLQRALAGLSEQGEQLNKRGTRRLGALVERGLATQAQDRHVDMGALLDQLQDLASPEHKARRAQIAGGAAALTISIGLASYAFLAKGPDPLVACEAQASGLQASLQQSSSQRAESFASHLRGEATHAIVEPLLLQYAGDWEDASRKACQANWQEGAPVESGFELRRACLDQRRTYLEVVVDALSHADQDTVDLAPQLVSDLPGLEACADAQALTRARVSLPVSPAHLTQINQVGKEFARLTAQIELGEKEGIGESVKDLVARARSWGHASTLAQALLIEAQWLESAGSEGREEVLREAFIAAQRGTDDRSAIEAAIELSHQASTVSNDHDQAMFWTNSAEALCEHLASTDALLARIEANRGYAQMYAMKYADAEVHLDRAVEYNRSSGGSAARRDKIMLTRAQVLDMGGRPDEALVLTQLVLEQVPLHFGAGHPFITKARASYATTLFGAGKLDEARAAYLRLLELYGTDEGVNRFRRISALLNLGELERRANNLSESEARARQALALLQDGEVSTRHQVIAYQNLSAVLEQRGRYQGGLEAAQAAVENMQEDGSGVVPQQIAESRGNVAALLLRVGRMQEARATIDQSIAELEKDLGDTHVSLVHPLCVSSAIAVAGGDWTAAKMASARGLALLVDDAESPNGQEPKRGLLHLLLAESLLELGNTGEASLNLKQAEGWLPDDNPELGWVKFLGARLALESGEQAESRRLVKLACTELAELTTPHDKLRHDRCLAWRQEHHGRSR